MKYTFMARSFSQTLIQISSNPIITPLYLVVHKSQHTYCRLLTVRNQSSRSENNNPTLIEPDLEALHVKRIEDAIHRLIVKRSAPDWLPFRPGFSYWVPPRRQSYGIAELVRTLANNLTEEEVMSLTTARGWPSATFFTTTLAPATDASPLPAEEDATSRNRSQSEDEE